ncbi:MAG TPA: DUF1957 domain-containing protein [Verrucomicrobiota bacterium]|nr:DUF1957 domain-containing protein [Verrucomicrobiota bacterium]
MTSKRRDYGRLALVLHAHLPYVRHPEHPQFHEETWLFEALLECYLPLLQVMEGWSRDQIPWRMTLSVSPTLAAMLIDPLLQDRFRGYLATLMELAEKETIRAMFEPARRSVADFYLAWIQQQAAAFERLRGDILSAWAKHSAAGHLELITCSATHATLPLLRDEPASLHAQLELALAQHARWAGVRPAGFWLPECAWTPELEPFLCAAGIRWFVTETQGLLHATPRPRQAIYAPLLTPLGLAVFAREPASAHQVWSRHGGYPGDPRYREFHRDVAHDADWDYVRPYLHGASGRAFTGLKFHRVTGQGQDKLLYDRGAALAAVREHAANFVSERARTASAAHALMSQPPVLLAPYDAELFGHWWFEGPEFLDAVVREVATGTHALELTVPSQHLQDYPRLEVGVPAASTWGEGGHFAMWLDESNAWMQPPLRAAGRRFSMLATQFADLGGDPLGERLLRQAARELLLAQASDWPFLVKMDTAGAYPARRFKEHLAAVDLLLGAVTAPDRTGVLATLAELESRHPLFPELDWRLWREHAGALLTSGKQTQRQSTYQV